MAYCSLYIIRCTILALPFGENRAKFSIFSESRKWERIKIVIAPDALSKETLYLCKWNCKGAVPFKIHYAMSVKYRKKKIVLAFDTESPVSKYVAANVLVGSIDYNKLCDEVNQRTGIHRGIVDVVIKGVQDTMISFLEEGFSVKLGEFGTFRPSLQAKSQDKEEDVDADTVSRVKIIFTPGIKFRQMLEE